MTKASHSRASCWQNVGDGMCFRGGGSLWTLRRAVATGSFRRCHPCPLTLTCLGEGVKEGLLAGGSVSGLTRPVQCSALCCDHTEPMPVASFSDLTYELTLKSSEQTGKNCLRKGDGARLPRGSPAVPGAAAGGMTLMFGGTSSHLSGLPDFYSEYSPFYNGRDLDQEEDVV